MADKKIEFKIHQSLGYTGQYGKYMTPLRNTEVEVAKDIIKHLEHENELAEDYIKNLKATLDEHDIDY